MEIRKHSSSSGRLPGKKPTVQLLAAVLLIVVGCGLLIAGFCVPPPGEIHNSVLVAFGEILTFAGAVFGMKYHYQYGHRPSVSQNQSHNPQEHDNH